MADKLDLSDVPITGDSFWAGTTPEMASKVTRTLVPAVASSMVTNLAPDPSLQGAAGYIPYTGAAEGLASTAGLVYNLGRGIWNRANAALTPYVGQQYSLNLPPAPQWMGQAGEHFANTQDQVYQQLPHYQPTQAEQQDFEGGKEFGQIVGNAVPVAPASVIAGLPRALRIPAQLMTPTTARPGTDLSIAATVPTGLQTLGITPTGEPDQQPAQQAQAPPADDFQTQLGNISTPFSQASQPVSASNAAATPQLDLSGAPTPFSEEGQGNWTIWQELEGLGIFTAALFAGRYVHGLGGAVTSAARDERVNNPEYAKQAADYNNAQIAAQAGAIGNAQGEQTKAPLMGAGGSLSDNKWHAAVEIAKNQVLDDTAQARDYIRMSSANPSFAERMANQFSQTMDPAAWAAKMREFLITGRDAASGIQIPAVKDLNDDLANLSRDQYITWKFGMEAANERNNRDINYQKGIYGPDARYAFPDTNNQQLDDYKQAMMNDPMLADLATRYWGIGRGLIDIGEARNFFTPQEANLMRVQHPNYLPDATVQGTLAHALGPRDVSARGRYQVNTDPAQMMAFHVEQLMRQFEVQDKITRPWTDAQLNFQTQNPQSAQFLKEVPNPYGTQKSLYATLMPGGSPNQDTIYQVRRGSGSKFYRSDNPDWFNWMKSQNPNKVNTIMGGIDSARKLVQSGTTGVASLATGQVFPLKHLGRVFLSVGVNRPRGTYGGLMDYALQQATKPLGKYGFGWRLPDPTNIPGYAYSYGRMQFDKAMRNNAYMQAKVFDPLSRLFDPTNPNPWTQHLKTVIGPTAMQDLSDRYKNYYLGTVSHEMRAAGVTNTGMEQVSQAPAYALGRTEGAKDVRSVSAGLTPELFMPPGRWGTIKAHFLNLRNALEEPYSDLMDAGNQHFYRLNRLLNSGIDPDTLAYETRQLVGNPSTRGASPLLQEYLKTVLYGNVGLQATGRTARALAETPLGTTAGLISSLGSLAILSHYTFARFGPAGLQYLSNMISTPQRSANVVLGTGNSPEDNTQISLPQAYSFLYPLVMDAVSKIFNLTAMMHDPNVFDGAYKFMKDWFSEHVENSSIESAEHGLARTFDFLQIPGENAINVPLAFLGKRLEVNLHDIIEDARNQGLRVSTFFKSTGSDQALPNHPVGDSLFEGEETKKFQAALSAAFGMLSSTIDGAIGLQHTHHILGGFFDTAGQAIGDMWQKIKDANPELNNVLWENTARESTRPPIVEMVQRRLDNMQATGGARNAEMMTGTTGGKFPLEVTPVPQEDRAVPSDPAMRQLYYSIQSEHKWLQSTFVGPINQIKKQMQDKAGQPIDNQQKRDWMNNQTRVIADKYRIINDYINDNSAKLSQMYGRRIDIGAPIDWKKGMDQFPLLN